MARIKVKVRSDVGDLGIHPKYGQLVKGAEIEIEEEEFGAGLFERPKNFLSPHEQKDKLRAVEEKQRVGGFEPPSESKKQEVNADA
jgi:hypothetical protein